MRSNNNNIPTKLSVNFNFTGVWHFALPTNMVRNDSGSKYYKISFPFGILDYRQTNPRIWLNRGNAGDYLVVNSQGTYGIVSKALYDSRFPSPLNYHTEPQPLSSKALQDPNFLTKIAEEYDGPSYNSIQVPNTPVSTPPPIINTPGGNSY
tara:strand:+ start:1261 stop:1713 length:453 start_codon:yes stop_codon:yes gene_type:complete